MATTFSPSSAAVCFASGVSRPSAANAASFSPAGLRLGSPFRSADNSSTWAAKSVSNGSRLHAFNVVNPNTNLKFETLSYLPPLTEDQVFRQIDYLLKKKLIPAIEFNSLAKVSRDNYSGPGYYDGRYWTLWKLPLFGASDPAQVLREVQEAKKAYPDSFIRVIGFDNVRQVQSTGFIVYRPGAPKA